MPHERGPKWEADWRDEFNRRHRKLFETEQGARIFEEQLRRQAREQRQALKHFALAEAITLETARDLYLTHLPVRPVTRAHLYERLSNFTHRIGQTTLAQLTPNLIDSFIALRRQELAPTSLARYAGDLKRWFGWLVRETYLAANPAAHLDETAPPAPPPHILTFEEEARVLAALTHRTRIRVTLALDAGLRRGEIHALRKNHVDREARTLTTWSTKTKSARTIPLTRRLQRELSAHLEGLAPDSLILAYAATPILKGTDFLKRLWPKVGFHFRFHDLRHTFATRIARATPNPFVVSALLGHSPTQLFFHKNQAIPRVTRAYVHPTAQELRAAIDAMEQANPNSSPTASATGDTKGDPQ